MAAALTSGRLKAWSHGAAFYGNTALGITQREGSAKMHKKGRPPQHQHQQQQNTQHIHEHQHQQTSGAPMTSDSDDAVETKAGGVEQDMRPTESCSDLPLSPEIEAEILARAAAVSKLVHESQVKTPAGMPNQGKVLREDNALLFVARLARLLRDRPAAAANAAPRIAFHWTAEANFQSIANSNLRVPDGLEVKKKHGSALGKGIYTSPDFRFAKEDFSYGASATFMLLVLPGVQEERRPGSRNNYLPLDPSFDSVRGRLPGRPCDTWVLPSSDQVLPCLLVDDVALPEATEVLRRCIGVLTAPWPDKLLGEQDPATSKIQQDPSVSASSSAVGPAGGVSPALAWLEEGLACPGTGVIGSSEAPADSSTLASDGTLGRWTRARARRSNLQGQSEEESGGFDGLSRAAKLGANPASQDTPSGQQAEATARKAAAPAGTALEPTPATSASASAAPAASAASAAGAGVGAGGGTMSAPSAGARKRWRNANKEVSAEGQVEAGEPVQDNEDSGSSMIRTIAANLLDAVEPIIAHQCSCVLSRPAAGVAAALFERFPAADVYRERREKGRPVDPPGTMCIRGSVANLFSQFCPGKALSSSRDIARSSYAELFSRMPGISDTKEERIEWFRTALDVLGNRWPKDAARVVAVPARIGCGLAGGDWPVYLTALQDFAHRHNIRVSIYDMEAQPGSVSKATGQVALTVSQHRRQQLQSPPNKDFPASRSAPASGTPFWRDCGIQVKSSDGTYAPLRDQASALSRVLVTLRDQDPTCSPDGHVVLEWQDASQAAQTAAPIEVRIIPAAVTATRLTLPEHLAADVLLESPLDMGNWLTQRELHELQPVKSTADSSCPICLSSLVGDSQEAVLRLPCGHHFHESCIEEWLSRRRECPTCKKRLGASIGNQPREGTMSWYVGPESLPGHSQVGIIYLKFHFPSGVDESGERYGDRKEEAFLPDNACGRLLLALFQLAFRRCIMFGLGISMAFGTRRATFNIHLKTAKSGGPNRHGYPDSEYFGRALEELRENGITADQLC